MNKPRNNTIIDKYLNSTNSTQSKKMRISSLNYFFKEEYFGYKDHVFNIDTQKLIDYFEWLKKPERDISLTTKRNKWNILKSFLNYTMEYYYKYDFKIIIPEKTIKWGNGHKKAESNKDVFMTKEEVKKLMDYFKTHNYNYYLVFRLLTETGMRKGGIINAKFLDVNTEKRLIEVYEKNSKEDPNIYYFSKNLAIHLEMYLEQCKNRENICKNLFITNRKQPFSLRTFNIVLNNACKQIGFTKKITCHTFRRSLNNLREEMECDPITRKILLNHRVTDVNYGSYVSKSYDKFINAYDKWNPYKELKF